MNLQMQKYPRARNGGDEAGDYFPFNHIRSCAEYDCSTVVQGLLCMIVISNALGPAREIGEKWSEQGLTLTMNRCTGQ